MCGRTVGTERRIPGPSAGPLGSYLGPQLVAMLNFVVAVKEILRPGTATGLSHVQALSSLDVQSLWFPNASSPLWV